MFGRDDPLNPTTDEIGWIVNLLYVGVGIGSVVPFFLMNRIGRKKTLLLATIPKIFCWIMIGLANSLTVILLGRILAGIGCGITYSLMPMYLGEISSKRSRGPLGTAMTVLLNIGALLICVIGLWVSRFTMAMLALSIPILFGLTFVWLPETSVFLMRQDDVEGAQRTLRWTLAKENVDEELEEVREIVKEEVSLIKSSTFELVLKMFTKRENKRAFAVAFIALSAMAFCGAVPILAYQSEIFQKANFHVSTKLCIIVTGSIMVLSGLLTVLIVRLTGKKPLLLIGSPLCFVSLASVATFFNLSSVGLDVSSFNWIPMVSVMIYVFGFGIAVNPIPLALVGEIFPFEMKPIAAVLSSLYYAVTTTTIVKYYQVMQDSYGTHVPIWTFSLLGMLLWILIYKFVPETEGKSLAEIQMDLRKEK